MGSLPSQPQDENFFRLILNNDLKFISPIVEPEPMFAKYVVYSMYVFIPKDKIKRSTIWKNSFIDTIFYAYNQHIDLQFSPEDILFIVTITVAGLIIGDKEKYSYLVKESKVLHFQSNSDNIENINWGEVLTYFCEQMQQYTTTDLIKAMEPEFSSTTSLHKQVHSGIMMGAYQNYFSFHFYDLWN